MKPSSRREARLHRQEAERLEQAEKSARLRERPEFKEVRLGARPESIFQMSVVWTCESPDREGCWERSGASRDWTQEQWGAVEAKLGEWAKLTWGEIDQHSTGSGHKMHHSMDIEVICDEAQYRLVSMDRYGDSIFRFRLGNKPRLWGFRYGANFDVIWYDREHDVYPTDPD